jgi:hypothetical protein
VRFLRNLRFYVRRFWFKLEVVMDAELAKPGSYITMRNGGDKQLTNNMKTNKIKPTGVERVPEEIVDAWEIALSTPSRSADPSDPKLLAVCQKVVDKILDRLFNSFRAKMKSMGIEIGPIEIAFCPAESARDTLERLTRKRFALEVTESG